MKLKTIANAFEEKVNEDKYGLVVFDNERNFTREELSRLADTIAAKLPQDSRRIGIIIGASGAVQRGAASCGVFPDRYGT